MFEDLWDPNDLEYTEHRLKVHVLTLKKSGTPYELYRLYGSIARILALRGNLLKAQDALTDADFLLVEHRWRGNIEEAWGLLDRAKVLKVFGLNKQVDKNVTKVENYLRKDPDPELTEALAAFKVSV